MTRPVSNKFRKAQLEKIFRRVNCRVFLLVSRCYLYGGLAKPLESVTDEEFLSLSGVGVKTLEDIRKVIPSPEK